VRSRDSDYVRDVRYDAVFSVSNSYAHRLIYSMLDAVPPIHAESSHVATDKGPLQVPVYF